MTDLDLSTLFPGPVIITEIREPVAPAGGALVFWDDSTNEGLIIQPLYTDRDRAALLRQMRGIAEEMTG
jgi:hypothetical protein